VNTFRRSRSEEFFRSPTFAPFLKLNQVACRPNKGIDSRQKTLKITPAVNLIENIGFGDQSTQTDLEGIFASVQPKSRGELPNHPPSAQAQSRSGKADIEAVVPQTNQVPPPKPGLVGTSCEQSLRLT